MKPERHPVSAQRRGESAEGQSAAAEIISPNGSPPAPEALRRALARALHDFRHDPFRSYPATRPEAWRDYALHRLDRRLEDPETLLFHDLGGGSPAFLATGRSRWDRDHFGFGVAKIGWVHSGGDDAGPLERLLTACLDRLRAEAIRLVTARLPADLLPAIHLFEDKGFRFYECLAWPVADIGDPPPADPRVRLMEPDDLARIVEIAAHHQYQRGHFHCDPRIDRRTADRLYAKWIETSWRNGEPIAVIEHRGRVAGYFNFRMGDGLSRALGYRYGRLRSLALDGAARGQGLGTALFRGTLGLIAESGGELVDSAYATKNHRSARLHIAHGFRPLHEEVTLHLWL